MQRHHLLPLLLPAALAAQCPNLTLTVSNYGAGCTTVSPTAPALGASLNTSTCVLAATINGFPGCCNTYRIGNLLVLGDQAAAVPVPQFGPSCTLLNSAVVVLFQPADQGTTFNLSLPPGLPPVTLYAQGASLYFTTIGLSYDWALTDGSQLNLQ